MDKIELNHYAFEILKSGIIDRSILSVPDVEIFVRKAFELAEEFGKQLDEIPENGSWLKSES